MEASACRKYNEKPYILILPKFRLNENGSIRLRESELSISFTSKRINRGRKRRGTSEFEEDNFLDDGNEDEEANVPRTKHLKD
jgi:hypothetical protein